MKATIGIVFIFLLGCSTTNYYKRTRYGQGPVIYMGTGETAAEITRRNKAPGTLVPLHTRPIPK